MNGLKRNLQFYNAVLMVLFVGFVPVLSQSQRPESLIVKAKGQGSINSALEERKIRSALVVLRQDRTALITVVADLMLQAEGTWEASTASPDQILLKITGGAVRGEVTGSGRLVLASDRSSIKELTLDLKSSQGQEISVKFIAGDSESVGRD